MPDIDRQIANLNLYKWDHKADLRDQERNLRNPDLAKIHKKH